MTAFEIFFYKHLNTLRRITQIVAIIFIFIVPILNKMGFNEIVGTFYSISVGNLDLVDPALVMQHILLTKNIYFPLLLAGMIPLIITLLFGKIFCGWICPFNLISEMGDKLRQKIRSGSVKIRNSNPRVHYYWLVFGIMVTFVAISGIPLITLISMPGLISGQAADLIFLGIIGIELSIVLVILLAEIFFKERFWCKFACPVGATLALLRSKHTLTIKYDAQTCGDKCPTDLRKIALCNSSCPLQLNPRQKGIYPYCYNCGACVDACQNKGGGAVYFTFHPK